MSTTYKAKGGEKWSVVARRALGDDTRGAEVKRANPGINTPLKKDAIIQLPSDQQEEEQVLDGGIVIKVDDKELKVWNNLSIALSVDAIRKCSFDVPNEDVFRKKFQPLKKQSLKIFYKNRIIFTGFCLSPEITTETLRIIGHSRPAILENCTASIEKYPLEWKNTPINEIAQDLCDEFGISAKFDDTKKTKFKRVDLQIGTEILSFLSDLANQRGFIISDNAFGDLVFTKEIKTTKIVSFVEEERHPVIEIKPNIDEGSYFSSVSGTIPKKSKKGKLGKYYTVENPYKTSVINATTVEMKDIDEGELVEATESQAARMFGELVTYIVELSTWDNDLGNVYEPGQLIVVSAPNKFIEEPFSFLIRTVNLNSDSASKTCQLELCLPGVFNGVIDERMPWE